MRVEEGDALDEKRAEEVAAEVGHHLLAEGTDALDVDEGDEGLDGADAPEAREEPGELAGRALAHETLQELELKRGEANTADVAASMANAARSTTGQRGARRAR